MKVLVACEESQAVCKEFRSLGHEAYSCDIQDCSGANPEWHIKGDAISILDSQKWDLVIAHPPCTFLSNSGVRWLFSKKTGFNHERRIEMDRASIFFRKFVRYGLKGNAIAIENPIMHKYGKDAIFQNLSKGYFTNPNPTQIIQPWMFGHTEVKATCLWLYNLPLLKETKNVKEQMLKLPYSERAKVHHCAPGPDRAKLRSKTFQGIAKAMAEQWGK